MVQQGPRLHVPAKYQSERPVTSWFGVVTYRLRDGSQHAHFTRLYARRIAAERRAEDWAREHLEELAWHEIQSFPDEQLPALMLKVLSRQRRPHALLEDLEVFVVGGVCGAGVLVLGRSLGWW